MLPLDKLFCRPVVGSRIKDYRLLRQSIFYLISRPRESSSAGVWLTSVDESLCSSPPNTWKLQNPVYRLTDFKPLREQAQVNLLDHRISEVARSYYLSGGYGSNSKTAMFFFPKSEDKNGNFSLLTLMWLNITGTNLILFNSRAGKWVTFPEVSDHVDGIILYEGKFYANDRKGGLIATDPITFEVKEIIKREEEERDRLYTHFEANKL